MRRRAPLDACHLSLPHLPHTSERTPKSEERVGSGPRACCWEEAEERIWSSRHRVCKRRGVGKEKRERTTRSSPLPLRLSLPSSLLPSPPLPPAFPSPSPLFPPNNTGGINSSPSPPFALPPPRERASTTEPPQPPAEVSLSLSLLPSGFSLLPLLRPSFSPPLLSSPVPPPPSSPAAFLPPPPPSPVPNQLLPSQEINSVPRGKGLYASPCL